LLHCGCSEELPSSLLVPRRYPWRDDLQDDARTATRQPDRLDAIFRASAHSRAAQTIADLGALREREDHTNAREIAAAVLRDPLAALNALTHLATLRNKRSTADIWTIEESVVMLGVSPFLERFSAQAAAEDMLKAHQPALLGLLRIVRRAQRAAAWARDWAIRRHDLDLERITVAALLHDLAETLMWCFAPVLALRVQEMQRADPTLRSRAAQKTVYGVTLNDLQLALVRHWRLPALLVEMMNDAHAKNARVRNVLYAVNLARHVEHGWDAAALPDDYASIADLLHMDITAVRRIVGAPAADGTVRTATNQ
jgi:HD-like signal output (HDOD) protein